MMSGAWELRVVSSCTLLFIYFQITHFPNTTAQYLHGELFQDNNSVRAGLALGLGVKISCQCLTTPLYAPIPSTSAHFKASLPDHA